MQKQQEFNWNFQRLGGLDQVMLTTSQELCHLDELDPKLWVALSCPSSGFEFDDRTLALIDTDNDGRIRVPEVVAAVEWTCARLVDIAVIIHPEKNLPLSAIDTSGPDGRELLAAAKAIIKDAGKEESTGISRADIEAAKQEVSGKLLNGDGVIPVHPDLDPEITLFVKDALAAMGGVKDLSGEPGINKNIAEAFMDTLRAWKTWNEAVSATAAPLGGDTPSAYLLLQKLKGKIDDYFLRCELASFAPQSTEALNVDQHFIAPDKEGLLNLENLAELPLSRIEPDRPLSLSSGLNPAWKDSITKFFTLAGPLLKSPDSLTRENWLDLQKAFEPYVEAQKEKPAFKTVQVDVPPVSGGLLPAEERINAILSGNVFNAFNSLLEEDEATPSASAEIDDMERLVLYYLHLYRLLMNFVSFYDFYSMDHQASFQAGTLYLDSRSCRLCLPVSDVEAHSKLASMSDLCLVYCKCARAVIEAGEEKQLAMNIVAAMTAGDSDLLVEGRNGVFIDNDGEDWDATVLKIVSNPISLWQAMWDPYKRFGRWVNEQISKFAAARQDKVAATATQTAITSASNAATGAAPAAPSTFDIGKNVGIFAAIGLAIGAIGTALASIAKALFALSWWQFPLVFLGLFLLISGPSLLLAWLKLRKRTLGPVLEASGWAVNSKVAINLMLAHELTQTAELPDNAVQSKVDPLGKPARRWPWAALILALVIGAGAGVWLWHDKPWQHWTGASSTRQNQQITPSGAVTPAAAPAPGLTGASISSSSTTPATTSSPATQAETSAPVTPNATTAPAGPAAADADSPAGNERQ